VSTSVAVEAAARLGLVCVSGVCLLGMLQVVELSWPGPNEYIRKLAHLGAGMLGLSCPALFSSHWPVLILACFFTGLLVLTRRLGWLMSLHRPVQRSNAAILFPWAVYAIFLLAQGDWLLFAVPVLVLTVGDTAAALIGGRFGRTRYPLPGNTRSVEGSAAFVAVAFVCVFALLYWSGVPQREGVLVSLCVAMVAGVVEAVSPPGTDNVIVPLATWLALEGWAAVSTAVS
jgi:phytol kinase